MTQGTLPKPLTPLLGAPSLKYALQHVAPHVPELVFIYSGHLADFSFEETVINLFSPTKCTFAAVPFATRGAVETALAGVLQLRLLMEGPIVFLSCDNVYPAAVAALGAPAAPFLGFDDSSAELLSFDSMYFLRRAPDDGTAVAEYAQKTRLPGARDYSTSVYGFTAVAQFLRWGRHTLQHGPFPASEISMPMLFVNMLAAGERVGAERVPIVPLGSAQLLATFLDSRPEQLRVCFALDGTLVTPPRVPGDLATVAPVAASVKVARWARAKGHTVIIHTTRVASDRNDVGRLTLDTLRAFGIPYDELIFGKPVADVFIDGCAVNPFINSPRAMGLPMGDVFDAGSTIINALPNNKYNTLRVVDGRVLKRGPEATMRGEVFFYEAVRGLPIADLFPAYYGCAQPQAGAGGGAAPPPLPPRHLEIIISLEKGVPLTTMMRAQLLEPYHLDAVVAALRALHACAEVPLTLPLPLLRASYADKLRARFADSSVYGTRVNAPEVLAAIEARLAAHSAHLSVAPVIHGDAWFANILLTPSNELRFVDMRGQVSGELTLNGDACADWAKLCQSVLGFDEVVFGLPAPPHEYRAGLLRALASALRAAGANTRAVLDVCVCLVAGSLHAYEEQAVRDGLWRFVVRALNPEADGEWAELVGILCDQEEV